MDRLTFNQYGGRSHQIGKRDLSANWDGELPEPPRSVVYRQIVENGKPVPAGEQVRKIEGER